MKKSKLKEAILQTLIYSDIFDYPLKREEIWLWLIKFKIQNSKFKITTQKSKIIYQKDHYFFIKSRENIVNIRKLREKNSLKKLEIAQKAVSILKIIPSIKLVGITGALAMNNTKKNDDIDLFIITSKDLFWTTRFLSTFLIEILGLRRHPEEAIASDKICLNMFMDEKYLEIPKKERDLFSAHEVLQMKPVWERENTYNKFILANAWVMRYLPNAYNQEIKKMEIKKLKNKKEVRIFPNYSITQLLNYCEAFLKKLQLQYMKKRRTTEIIKNAYIRFHPHDARKWILASYHKRLKDLKL